MEFGPVPEAWLVRLRRLDPISALPETAKSRKVAGSDTGINRHIVEPGEITAA